MANEDDPGDLPLRDRLRKRPNREDTAAPPAKKQKEQAPAGKGKGGGNGKGRGKAAGKDKDVEESPAKFASKPLLTAPSRTNVQLEQAPRPSNTPAGSPRPSDKPSSLLSSEDDESPLSTLRPPDISIPSSDDRSPSPRDRSPSPPRDRSPSPRDRSPSPNDRSPSPPCDRSPSPPDRSPSPHNHSPSPPRERRRSTTNAPSQVSSRAPSQVPSHGLSRASAQGSLRAPSQGSSRAPSHGSSRAPSHSSSRAPSQGSSRAPSQGSLDALSQTKKRRPSSRSPSRHSRTHTQNSRPDRSRSPSRTPHQLSPASMDSLPAPRLLANTHAGRTQQGDYEDYERKMIKAAGQFFRVLLATEQAYPERVEDGSSENDMIAKAWASICQKRKNLRLTPGVHGLIKGEKSQLRNRVASKALGCLHLYGILDSNPLADNRARVTELLDEARFAFQDTRRQEGVYKHPAIITVIKETWFTGPTDAKAYPICFNPIPAHVIALVLTAIHYAFDVTLDGPTASTKDKRAFAGKAYSDNYANVYLKMILTCMNDYPEVFKDAQAFEGCW
ncbi:hypothetical protein BOTBODRAFT_173973 [Botryobasidium botryosum FD-172 SS1]|uniref:DUF6532 domain-containing protein n=1 Tax=Botryobasidium botryosum (strain FD-172 SS1) TaxID=930990 RepID=A0A067MUF0_BOTB1|nr:hypothetical protein BOTBODRAFT_173973 [Botryobasidium botryosum FD-172 SS1]